MGSAHGRPISDHRRVVTTRGCAECRKPLPAYDATDYGAHITAPSRHPECAEIWQARNDKRDAAAAKAGTDTLTDDDRSRIIARFLVLWVRRDPDGELRPLSRRLAEIATEPDAVRFLKAETAGDHHIGEGTAVWWWDSYTVGKVGLYAMVADSRSGVIPWGHVWRVASGSTAGQMALAI